MKIFYLAHPVRGDEYYSEEENLQHVLKVQKILWEAGLGVSNPWYTFIKLFPNHTEPETMARFLAFDCEHVKVHKALVLTGHRLSSGMGQEWHALADEGGELLDLIGVPDADLAACVKFYLGESEHRPDSWVWGNAITKDR